MKTWMKKSVGFLAIAMACVLIGSAFGTTSLGSAAADEPTVVTSPFTAAVAEVRDSVVGINNYQQVRYSNGYGNYGSFPYDFFFGGSNGFGGYGDYGQQPRSNGQGSSQEVLAGSGSGTVIADGFVLTNHHVIENSSRVTVTVADENGEITEYDAEVVAYDENVDVAVVRCEKLPLKPVKLGDSDKLLVGDWAICIGNPLGSQFSGTVTVGVVSALNRNISSTNVDKYGRRETVTNTMIQTDAAINNGNSGGGMFSTSGELMGIPTMKYTGNAFSGKVVDNIGMCVPINAAKPIIEDALSGNYTAPAAEEKPETSANNDMIGKPRMGISVSNINTNSSAVMSGALPKGVYVAEVEKNAPADVAGMQVGDIIVDLDDTVITSVSQLQQLVASHGEGDTLKVKVYRVPGLDDLGENDPIPDGEYVDLEVTLTVVDVVKQ
ncbi:MAG: trypsin-like peptidase domain-containing protein [Clostridia bacterium]|nr:trypsin-like peptidase domain-containing protein [Clostridia bacterium]